MGWVSLTTWEYLLKMKLILPLDSFSSWQNSRNTSILLPWLQAVIVHLTFRGEGSQRICFITILVAFNDWYPYEWTLDANIFDLTRSEFNIFFQIDLASRDLLRKNVNKTAGRIWLCKYWSQYSMQLGSSKKQTMLHTLEHIIFPIS